MKYIVSIPAKITIDVYEEELEINKERLHDLLTDMFNDVLKNLTRKITGRIQSDPDRVSEISGAYIFQVTDADYDDNIDYESDDQMNAVNFMIDTDTAIDLENIREVVNRRFFAVDDDLTDSNEEVNVTITAILDNESDDIIIEEA